MIELAVALGPVQVSSIKRLDTFQFYIAELKFGSELSNIDLSEFDQSRMWWRYERQGDVFEILAKGDIEVMELTSAGEALLRAVLGQRGEVVAAASLEFRKHGDSPPLREGRDYRLQRPATMSVALAGRG